MFKIEDVSEDEFKQFKRNIQKSGVAISTPNDVSPNFTVIGDGVGISGVFTGDSLEITINKRPFWLPEDALRHSLELMLADIVKDRPVTTEPEVIIATNQGDNLKPTEVIPVKVGA